MNLVEQVRTSEGGTSKTTRNFTEIPYEVCGENNLNFDDLNTIKTLGIDEYY